MLAMAADCPARTVLALAGMEDAGEPRAGTSLSMLAGIWGHKAHAAWLQGNDWEEALAPYADISKQGGFADDRRGHTNIRAVLDAVLSRLHRDRLPFDLVDGAATEITFTAPLGEVEVRGTKFDVVLIGVLDGLIREKATGHKMPLEVKFTGRLDSAFISKFVEYDIQTTAYIYAAGLTQDVALGECFVSAFEMASVPTSDRLCNKHGVVYAECGPEHVKHTFISVRRTPARLNEFKALALRIASRYIAPAALMLEKHGVEVAQSAPRSGMFTMACDTCEFRKWCLVNERAAFAMTTMLRKRTFDDRRIRSGLLTVEESEKLVDSARKSEKKVANTTANGKQRKVRKTV